MIPLFTLFLRAVLLYGCMILVIRLLGKRQLGEFQPYELALTILLADLISEPIGSVATPLLCGLLPAAAVMIVNALLSLIAMKSDRLRAIISGKPTLVISRGRINRRELDRLCLSLSDLLEGLRSAGYLDPSGVGTAVVEANGAITAFPDAASRPPTTAELGVSTAREGLPLPLVMDGRIQQANLRKAGKSAAWLRQLLCRRGYAPEAVYLAMLDTRGCMSLHLSDGAALRFQALPPEEVSW